MGKKKATKAKPDSKDQLERWRLDPVAFVQEAFLDPETGKPFELFPEQIDFLHRAFTVGPNGRLPFSEILWSAIKRSGKTTLSAWMMIYCTAILDKCGESFCCANDFDQAISRVFAAAEKLIHASPVFKGTAKVTQDKITFANGATIQAVASDYAGAAGASPTLISFDELWAYTSERSRRLWDELIPVPTRKISCRLTTSYAGFTNESSLLESLRERGLAGTEVAPSIYESPGMICANFTKPIATWQTPEWIDEMKRTLRPTAFARLIENRFVGIESALLTSEMIDQVTREDIYPSLGGKHIRAYASFDLSLRSDFTAITACTITPAGKIRLLTHTILRPDAKNEMDFSLVESLILDLQRRFDLVLVAYDPWQAVSVAQRLADRGVNMMRFDQTSGNISEASACLYDLIKNRQIELYPSDEIREALLNCTAIENPRRGTWHIGKDKASRKVDAACSLAWSAMAAVKHATKGAWGVQDIGWDYSEEQRPAPYFQPAESMSAAHSKEDSFRAKYGRDRIPLNEAELNGCYGSTQYRNQWISRGDFLSGFSPEELEMFISKNPVSDSDFGDGTPPGGPDWGFCPGEDLLRDAMHAATNRGPSRLEWKTQPLSR